LDEPALATEPSGTSSAASVALRAAGVLLVLLLGAAFVFVNRSEIPAAGRALRDANFLLIALAAGISAGFMLNLAAFHLATYRAVGLELGFRQMLRLAAGSYFVNMVAKSGGFGGLALFLQDARRREQSRGRVITAYFLHSLLGHIAFVLVLVVALVVVWLDGRLTTAEIVGSLIFVAYMGFFLATFVAAIRSRAALRFIHALPSRVAHRAFALVGRRPAPWEPDHEAADDLYEAVHLLIARPRSVLVPAVFAILVEVLGVATIWAVLWARGQHVGLTAPLVAYAIAVLFSIVGVLPGGLGFAEASLGAVFSSFGVPGATAAVAVIIYRVFEVWVPFVVGAWAVQSLARRPGKP